MPSTHTAHDALARAPLFSDLTQAELQQVAGLFHMRRFPAGRSVVRQGQGGDAFFVLDSGSAMVTIDGREQVALSPGEYFGEVALFDRGMRTATITASEEIVCYVLTYADFKALVENNGVIGWKLLERMARMLRDALRH